jgi:hypothetical protein
MRSVRFRRDSAFLNNLRRELAHDGLSLNHSFFGVPAFRKYSSEEMLRTVASRSLEVLKAYRRGKRKPLDEFIGNRTYVFVIGSPRTGGSYTTRRLGEVLCEYRTEDPGDPVVLNESIPTFDHFALSALENHERQAQYSLIRWLVWIDLCYQHLDVIVKKSSGFPFAMDLVDRFMGEARCHYVVTTRHPGPIYRSHEKLSEQEGGNLFIPVGDDSYLFEGTAPQWWTNASRKVRTLYYWSDLYGRLASTMTSDQKENCSVVKYGEQSDVVLDVVREIDPSMEEHAKERVSQNSFLVRSRTYSPFWNSRITQSVINERRRQWKRKGLSFPVGTDTVE